jgi:hypothetical protein
MKLIISMTNEVLEMGQSVSEKNNLMQLLLKRQADSHV